MSRDHNFKWFKNVEHSQRELGSKLVAYQKEKGKKKYNNANEFNKIFSTDTAMNWTLIQLSINSL